MTIQDSEDSSPTYANVNMLGLKKEYSQSSINSPEDLYTELDLYTNMSQFREPPPYPGLPKQSNSQTGLHQSFSGSETSTDVSVSSTENLASGIRQEPQGEETQGPVTCVSCDTSEYSILERLGMPASELEQKSSAKTPQIYVSSNYQDSNYHGPYMAHPVVTSQGYHMGGALHQQVRYSGSSDSGFKSPSVSNSKLTTESNSASGSYQNIAGLPHYDQTAHVTCAEHVLPSYPAPSTVGSYNAGTIYRNYPQMAHQGAPEYGHVSHYSQYVVPAHHDSMSNGHMVTVRPPPDYPGITGVAQEARRSYEILGVKQEQPGSRSQPDLPNFYHENQQPKPVQSFGIIHTPGNSGSDKGSHHSIDKMYDPARFDIDKIAAQATHMVDFLTEENRTLRQKLAVFDRKVTKLQKFELEIQKVHEGYESLVKSSKKREQLELAMKKRLEEEVKKLKAINGGLVQQLQTAGITVPDTMVLAAAESTSSDITHLLAKHKEVLTLKERLEREIEAQKVTIQEQRTQIEILRSVQTNQIREDEEALRQQIIAEYDREIQLELADIKAAYEKKGQTEQTIRQKLERDVEHCRLNHGHLASGTGARATDGRRDVNADLKELLKEKEAKILQQEKELIQWKEQHLEESIRKLRLPEIEIDTPPMYNQSSSSTETLIHEAKTEKLKQMEEVYQANRKIAELEANVKSLKSQLKERDAMLRVYQRSPITRSSSVHSIYCTPHHSPRPSFVAATTTGSLSRQGSQDVASLLEGVRHKKTGSATAAMETLTRCAHSQEDLLKKSDGLKAESKSETEAEGEDHIDSVWQV